jgi:hypothetical protein
MQILAAAAGAGLSVPTITSVSSAYQTATVYFTPVAGAVSYTVTAVGRTSTSGGSSPLTVTGLTNYASYYYTVSATDGATTVTSAQFGPVTVDVPCPAGTQAAPYCTYYTTTVGGVANGCVYNYVCNGVGGFGLNFCSGPCYTLSGGDYCGGCYPAQ